MRCLAISLSLSLLLAAPAAAQIPGLIPPNQFLGGPASGSTSGLSAPRRLVTADMPASVQASGAKCDGTTDDTAAIVAAIAATPAGGTLTFPPSYCLVNGSGAEILLLTRAINLQGSGMQGGGLLVASSVPNSRDIIHIVPNNNFLQERGWSIRDLAIQPQSGVPGRHAVHVDTTSSNTIFAAELEIRRAWIYGTPAGNAVYFNNTSAGLGVFNSGIYESLILGPVNLQFVGDSIRLDGNIISTTACAQCANPITISQLGGAGNIVIENSNITGGGAVVVNSATGLVFTHNEFEQITTNTETLAQGVTNAVTAAGNPTLHFAATPAGVVAGMSIFDLTTPSAIPAGTTVNGAPGGTTVTMSANAAGAGVGSGDIIGFGNNVMLDITGAVAQVVRPLIIGNQIQANGSTNAPNLVRVANAVGAVLDQNYFGSVASVVAVINTAAASSTVMGPNNTFVGTSAQLTDASTNTIFPMLPLAPNRITVLKNGNIGIGTDTNPLSGFVLSQNVTTGINCGPCGSIAIFAAADGVSANYALMSYGTNTNGSVGFTVGGTAASPSATPGANRLNGIGGNGFANGVFTSSKAIISLDSVSAWTNTDNSTQITLQTTPVGSIARAVAMTVQASGGVSIGVGTADPGIGAILAAKTIASGTTTVGALPTCNAAAKGARYFVTDNNTAIAYHGGVTGAGANQQGVTCDGTIWYQD